METPESTPARPDRRSAFLLLFFCLLAVGAGNTMLTTAVLPPLTRELGLPDWTGGAIFSLSAAVWSITAPYWGGRSNALGRRPVAAIGMVGFAVSMFLFGVVMIGALHDWIQGWILIFVLLLAARTLFGVFGSATNPAAQAYVADRTSLAERTGEIASLTSGFTLGQVAGPAGAAVIISAGVFISPTVGLVAPVFFITIVALGMAWLVMAKLPENRPPQSDAGIQVTGAKGLWRRPEVFPFLAYAVGLSLITGVLQQTFPYAIMDRMGVSGPESAQYTGPALTLGAMATLISQLVLIPRLRLTARSLMVYGALLLALSGVVTVWAMQFAVLAFAQILFGLGQGLARPGFSAGASLSVDADLQGDIAGLVTAANGMGFVVAPVFGLGMYQYVGPWAPFAFSAVVMVALCAYAFFRARHGEAPPPEPGAPFP
ncbi:MAG: MFS transporter [Hyphomonadaceae bacterium]